TSIDATAVCTQFRSDPSASGYCTCTICSTVARTTPSIEIRASCAEKCQAGAAGRDTESNVQGSSPNRCVPPRKRSTKSGSRTLRSPSTSSSSTEASGSSVNPEQRAQAQAGQYERPHRCPCNPGLRCRQPRRPEGDASAADCRIIHHVLDDEPALGRIALEPASPDGGIGSTRAIEVDAVPEPQTIPGFRIASGNEPRLVEAALGNPR